ncbi:MAG: sulfatase [Halioglobus sp.]|nr:sulfatase [Halioglobus sp.]
MTIFTFFWNRITAAISTLLLLIVLTAIFMAYRLASSGQADNQIALEKKRDYLTQISQQKTASKAKPNIVFILYDDMGYGDLGAGAKGNAMIATPNINKLAAEGVILTDFYSPASVCTPSRAGYLTGRLPARAGLTNVIFPTDTTKSFLFNTLLTPNTNVRLPAEEITLADLLSAAGYATGMVGKWHLGDRSPSLPNDMGFDSYFGALYSNDMEPFALYANRDVAVRAPVDQRFLTEHYTQAATNFIRLHAEEPFFLYFAHNFPHDPLAVRPERSGKSKAGLYGDVLEEIDDSVGAIVAILESTGNLDNTLIIISSDNGPWFLGDAGDQRGRKGNTFEGGMRVPFIASWPAGIAPGRTEEAMAMGIDLLPTILDLLQLPAPSDRILDGRSILSILTEGGVSPHEYLFYYSGENLFAVRDQRFKYRGPGGVFYSIDQAPVGVAIPKKEWLFDLAGDTRESYDTSDRNPQELGRLRAIFEAKNREMTENKRGWK